VTFGCVQNGGLNLFTLGNADTKIAVAPASRTRILEFMLMVRVCGDCGFSTAGSTD